jgi:hypothetical protein
MSDLNDTIDTYLRAWSEQDPDARAELVGRVWARDGRLIDPPMAATGPAEISGLHGALQQQFPGHTFRRASAIDAHHDHLRFAGELVGPDGSVALRGLDVGEVGDDGHLRRITGFFGELEAA